MHHNYYCIIKKFIYQIGNLEVRNRQEQTGEKVDWLKKKAVSKTAQDRSQKQTDSKEILISFKMEEHQAEKNLANFY